LSVTRGHGDYRFCRFGGGSQRRRHVHHEDGVALTVFEQGLERRCVSRIVGVASDIDRIGA